MVIEQAENEWGCYDALFNIIKGWLTKDSRVLSKIEDIVMDLEGDAEIGSEIEELSLIFNVQIVNKTQPPTSKRYHTSRLIISLGYIRFKI